MRSVSAVKSADGFGFPSPLSVEHCVSNYVPSYIICFILSVTHFLPHQSLPITFCLTHLVCNTFSLKLCLSNFSTFSVSYFVCHLCLSRFVCNNLYLTLYQTQFVCQTFSIKLCPSRFGCQTVSVTPFPPNICP